MWILPRQLISAFAPVMGASTLDLDAASQACAQLLMRRSKRSQSSSYLREWKSGNLMRLQSGLICDPSRGRAFETAWTSSLAVIPVSHSAQPASDLEQTTSDTSGQLSQLAFEFCDQDSASSRTSRDTSALGYGRLSMSWEQWVTERRGEHSARLKSGLRTNASECSSWPSPVASEVRQGFQDRSRGKKGSQESLTTVVLKSGPPAQDNPSTDGSRRELWPTPDATGANDGVPWEKFEQGMQERRARVKEAVAHGLTKQGSGRSPNLCASVQNPEWNNTVSTGKLNPRWVETLMGLPVGWVMPSCASPVTIEPTNSDCSVTESCQQPPQGHLPF